MPRQKSRVLTSSWSVPFDSSLNWLVLPVQETLLPLRPHSLLSLLSLSLILSSFLPRTRYPLPILLSSFSRNPYAIPSFPLFSRFVFSRKYKPFFDILSVLFVLLVPPRLYFSSTRTSLYFSLYLPL